MEQGKRERVEQQKEKASPFQLGLELELELELGVGSLVHPFQLDLELESESLFQWELELELGLEPGFQLGLELEESKLKVTSFFFSFPPSSSSANPRWHNLHRPPMPTNKRQTTPSTTTSADALCPFYPRHSLDPDLDPGSGPAG